MSLSMDVVKHSRALFFRTLLGYIFFLLFIKQLSHPYLFLPVISVFAIWSIVIWKRHYVLLLPELIGWGVFALVISGIIPLPYTWLIEREYPESIALVLSVCAATVLMIGLAAFVSFLRTKKA